MFLIKIAAGLALITFGVRFLRKGLDRLFGGRLIAWLERATKNRVQAMCAGAVTGALAPSSTGLSLLTMQFLGAGKIGTDKLLAILLGANVGMTFLVNVAALQVGDYAGILLFLGVVGFQFVSRERIRGIGQCLLSLGFIFLAMSFLRQGADVFAGSDDVGAVFNILNRHPYVLCLGAAVVAVVLQSSTAAIGLGIALASGGALPNAMFVTWIVGTNLGIGCTSLFVSWRYIEGRRLGLANLFMKALVAILVVVFGPLNFILSPKWSLPMSQQLALMQTAFNVLVAVISLPLLGKLLALVKNLFVPGLGESAEAAANRTFLDPQALESPSVALANATREALRMTDEVREMLQNVWAARAQKSVVQIKSARAQDDTVDQINHQLMLYLSQIGELSDADRKWHFTLLTYSSELESIGDTIEKNLSSTLSKQLIERLTFDAADEAALGDVYQRTLRQFDLVASLMTGRASNTAQQLIKGNEEIIALCVAQKKIHYERLKPGSDTALSSSLCYLDLLDGLRRVSQHLSTVAHEMRRANTRPKKAKPNAQGAAENGGELLLPQQPRVSQ